MPVSLPRREKAAAKVGPRLEISPLEVSAQLENEHGLSNLICNASTWEPFAWKGNDLSAPMRALWVAESRGLLRSRGDRANDVAISDITADINEYLMSFGKKPVSESSVRSNLAKAALYANAAVGVSIIPDRQSMTVRLVDKFENAENIERYFEQMNAKMKKLGSQLKHAQAMNFPVAHLIAAAEESTGLRLSAAPASVED